MAMTHGENDFTEISENLARFENNFDYQNNYVGRLN